MKKSLSRIPLGYDGTRSTTRHLKGVLPAILRNIGAVHRERPDLVVAAWAEVIGPQLAPMTRAVSLRDGVLTVKVRNSTLFSLLNQHEKPRLLQALRRKFPKTTIQDIVFRIG